MALGITAWPHESTQYNKIKASRSASYQLCKEDISLNVSETPCGFVRETALKCPPLSMIFENYRSSRNVSSTAPAREKFSWEGGPSPS